MMAVRVCGLWAGGGLHGGLGWLGLHERNKNIVGVGVSTVV